MAKLTEARLRVLSTLTDKPRLLIGAALTTARYLSMHKLAKYHGVNHYSITDLGRQALTGNGRGE